MRRITNSGGALTPELIDRLRRTFPRTDIVAMYGLTEAFRSTYLEPALLEAHPTSIGRAIPFAEILVVDEAGNLLPAGQQGELVHCGPLVAQGYWQDEARTAKRFKPAPACSRYGGTAVWSGDLATRDEGGLLYFVGRSDAMIKSSGNRISPHEIESAALASGLVVQAVAIGVPDDALGHAIHLIASHKGDTDGVDEALRRYLAKELPNFMHPHVIDIRQDLPLNPNGKIDRASLLAEAMR